MKIKILIGIIILMMAMPAVSHGFGLLRYIFDGVYNQLGLDRGPIPKVVPPPVQPGHPPTGFPEVRHSPYPRFHIQAEGF